MCTKRNRLQVTDKNVFELKTPTPNEKCENAKKIHNTKKEENDHKLSENILNLYINCISFTRCRASTMTTLTLNHFFCLRSTSLRLLVAFVFIIFSLFFQFPIHKAQTSHRVRLLAKERENFSQKRYTHFASYRWNNILNTIP